VERPVEFEWDPEEAQVNIANHGVSFEEAVTAFDDPWSLTVRDEEHSVDEDREFTLGVSASQRLLAIAHTARGDCIRLISARLATPRERRTYAEEPD
jgi:uncharacterized DUF497 family protein